MCKLPDGRDWQWEKLGLALVGRALLSKALIQLSANVLPPWSLFGLRDPALGSAGFMVGLMVNFKRVYAKGELPGLMLPVPLSLW